MATKTRTCPPRSLPFDPVDRYLLATTEHKPLRNDGTLLGVPTVTMRLGVLPGRTALLSERTIRDWREQGIDVWTADALAAALGMQPDDGRLWAETWCEAADEWVASIHDDGPPEPCEQGVLL